MPSSFTLFFIALYRQVMQGFVLNLFYLCSKLSYEPGHDKSYNKTCATSQDSDQAAQFD